MAEGETREVPRALTGSSRRRGRQVALQVLYAIDLGTDRPGRNLADAATESWAGAGGAPDPDGVFEIVAAHFEMPEGARLFARDLATAVRFRIEDIDTAITSHARNWRLTRMAVVDRNILRLGSYELLFTDTPTAVVVNEAVDLARRFGSEASPAFVNGVLDAVARDLREENR